MFETKCSSLHQHFKKKSCLSKQKKGEKKLTFPIFDNEFSSSPKKLKISPKECVFQIKHEDMCDYNPKFFMSDGLMLDDIIMNLFSETV